MAFTPMVPAGGILGYRLLTSTEGVQREVFDRQPEIARETAYFREKIASVASAADLVTDRRLLAVALGAFGLDEDIDKQAFVRKILEEGTDEANSMANRLVDPRYKRFAESFGFGNATGAQTARIGFSDRIVSAYNERQFEVSVGEQDETLRIALNFRREIARYANATDPDGTAWFSVMGDEAVREVFDVAFGLGSSFGQLDIDRQRDDLRDMNDRYFGNTSLEIFKEPEMVDKMIDRYLARKSIENGPSALTPGMAALTLLNASNGLGETSIQNIVLSSIGRFRSSL
ncbi:MAG: DUF1217 domain-containing protein [Pseudomonadota bacterium]